MWLCSFCFFFSSRRRHTRCALVTGFRRVLFRSAGRKQCCVGKRGGRLGACCLRGGEVCLPRRDIFLAEAVRGLRMRGPGCIDTGDGLIARGARGIDRLLTGGTLVSSALEKMLEVVKDRYNPEDWNIYVAQASDGDNMASDNPRTVSLMQDAIIPMSQYVAYLEVGREEDPFRSEEHTSELQ